MRQTRTIRYEGRQENRQRSDLRQVCETRRVGPCYLPKRHETEMLERPSSMATSNQDRMRRKSFRLLAIRREYIMPRLRGAKAMSARTIGPSAVLAQWRLTDATLTLATNLGADSCTLEQPAGRMIFETAGGRQALTAGKFAPFTTLAFLE